MRTYILIAALVVFAGCGLEPKNHTMEIQKMEDTIFKSFPTVNRASIEIRNDFGTEINITLGDAELYNAPEGAREKVANELTAITQHIFTGEKFRKGKVIFVKEETTAYKRGTEKTLEMQLHKAE